MNSLKAGAHFARQSQTNNAELVSLDPSPIVAAVAVGRNADLVVPVASISLIGDCAVGGLTVFLKVVRGAFVSKSICDGEAHSGPRRPVARLGRKHRLMTPSLALRGALASRIDGGRYEVSPCLPLHREIKELQLCSAHRC